MTALSGPLHPTDLIDMAHSPAYFAAAGVADHAFSWDHASAAKIADPVIHGLIDRVQFGAPPTEDAARYRQGATVTIARMTGGVSRTRCTRRKARRRSGSIGATSMRSIARWCRWRAWAQEIEASLALIHDFRRITDVAALAVVAHRVPALTVIACHCEERSDAVISIVVHNAMGIASLRSQ